VPEAAETSEAPLRACPDCGAALLDERQEMCVECGAAVAPEPGAARRFRWALRPAALGVFATLMVASAAYGLSSNLGDDPSVVDQVAAAPPPVGAASTPAAPPAGAPAEAAAAPAPAKPVAPAPSPAAAPAAPASPSTASPSAAPAPGHSGSGGGSGDGSGSGGSHPHDYSGSPARHDPKHPQTRPSWLGGADQPYSARLYDPYGDGTDEHSAAAPKAVDGHVRSAWTTADHPGGLGKTGVGLVVEAGGYQSYSAIGIQTDTPGFKAEIYSTDAPEPPQGGPSAAGWRREGANSTVKKQQRIGMKGATGQPSYVLVWITTLPAGKSRAGLSEISLLP
jgi:hypothetical protein